MPSQTIILVLVLLAGCVEQLDYRAPAPWQDRTAVPAIGAGKIVVTNSGEDSVTWIDLETLEVVATMPVGLYPAEREGPHHGAAGPGAIYVGLSNFVPGGGGGPHGSHGDGTAAGYVLKYSVSDGALLGATLIDRNPGDVRLTPDARTVLVSHFDLRKIDEGGSYQEMSSRLAILDAATLSRRQMVPVCPGAHGIVADDQRAWVTCWATDEIAEVGLVPPYPVTRRHLGSAPIDPLAPAEGPYAASLHDDGSLWVSCQSTGVVRVLDGSGERASIAVGGVPYFGAFTSDGTRFLVPSQGTETLSVVDVASGAVQKMALPAVACRAPHAVLVLPGDARALVVCEGDHVGPGTVAVVNIAIPTPAVEKFVRVGVFPDDLLLVTQ
jgi:YVTN family beta-propeller protein